METLVYVTIAYTPKMKSWLQMATRSSLMRESVFLLRPYQGQKNVQAWIHLEVMENDVWGQGV